MFHMCPSPFPSSTLILPVTVVQVGPCAVVQRKTKETDGYEAAQIGFEEQKPQRLAKAQQKHFEKAGIV